MKAAHPLRITLSAIALAAAALSAGTFSMPALAAAPMAKTTAPAFYRTMLGDFEVTALGDGTLAIPPEKVLTNIPPERVKKELDRHYQTSPLDFSINAYLINTGSKLVLIDTGTGGAWGPTAGSLLANLKASGYQPEQVDEIYITHMHGDHFGGLSANGNPVFPNAIVRADKHDADYWLSQANLDKAPEAGKADFKNAIAAFEPYAKAGRFKTFDGNTDLVPGVRAVAAYGHTPGHTVYVVESKGKKLVVWGDLMHVAAVQFEHPEVTINFDTDSKAAAAERRKIFAEAAKEGYLIGAAHVSWPGLGRLRREGTGYQWEPILYMPVR
jgi:glyoxylase-like metal-dependent hydrolase (beta-lactamase superfamily II)